MLGVLGWLVATFGPIVLAAIFWRLANGSRAAWLLHLLFLPCAYALLRAGAGVMLFVIGDFDFDSTLGGPVLQAGLLFMIASAAYFVAVAWSVIPLLRCRI